MKLVKTALLLTLAAATVRMLGSRARPARAEADADVAGTPARDASNARSPNAGERVQAALAGGDGALAGSGLAHDDLLAPGTPRAAFAPASVADPMRGA